MGETQQGGHTERQNNEAADNDNFDVSGKKSTLSIIGQERADVTHLKPRFPLSHCMRKAAAPCRSKKCEERKGKKNKIMPKATPTCGATLPMTWHEKDHVKRPLCRAISPH